MKTLNKVIDFTLSIVGFSFTMLQGSFESSCINAKYANISKSLTHTQKLIRRRCGEENYFNYHFSF